VLYHFANRFVNCPKSLMSMIKLGGDHDVMDSITPQEEVRAPLLG
jgi:hypothetical protein